METIVFDSEYYRRIMDAFGYDPLAFEPITFGLGSLKKEELGLLFLCHQNASYFSDAHRLGKKVIATTGFGLTGAPHMGTLGQIFRAIRLQNADVPVQIVLGDLDAYNGKSVPLETTLRYAAIYREFILRIGFREEGGSRLRGQYGESNVLRHAFLIANAMDDEMFDAAEEDLHEYYVRRSKVDASMTHRRKMSLNLMSADFSILLAEEGYDAILVFLGIDEHQYVRFAAEAYKRYARERGLSERPFAAIYSGIVSGLNGYPKMSKSFPDSSVHVEMPERAIVRRIVDHRSTSGLVDMDPVYQMIASASGYSPERIREARDACEENGKHWKEIKREYAELLLGYRKLWRSISGA